MEEGTEDLSGRDFCPVWHSRDVPLLRWRQVAAESHLRLHRALLGHSSICANHETLGSMSQGAASVLCWALGRI